MQVRRLNLIFIAFLVFGLLLSRFATHTSLVFTSGIAPLYDLFGTFARNVKGSYNFYVNERQLDKDKKLLLKENDSLKRENALLKSERDRLKNAVDIRNNLAPGFFNIAQIRSVEPLPVFYRLRLKLGSANGVQPFMPAVTGQGLVGYVIDVARDESLVMTILDPDSSVGIGIDGKKGRGTVRGMAAENLVAEFPRNVKLVKGDKLYTISFGGVYPTGIPVGTVIAVNPVKSSSIYQKVLVKPAVDIQNLEEVALLNTL